MIIVSPRINVQLAKLLALPGENRGCRLARMREYAFRIRIIIFSNNASEHMSQGIVIRSFCATVNSTR